MSNELIQHNGNVPATQQPPAQETILKSDITIPKVLQMQALS